MSSSSVPVEETTDADCCISGTEEGIGAGCVGIDADCCICAVGTVGGIAEELVATTLVVGVVVIVVVGALVACG